MTERQNCCRLCLAPDSECISILKSYAADKEPLTTKIQNCVNIQISEHDNLSLRICHACISYLNSWQSFKNRCISSQTKQRSWLEAHQRQQLRDNNVSVVALNSDGATAGAHEPDHDYDHEQNEDYHEQSNLSSSILDGISSLKKRKSLTVYPLPAVQIKDEPIDLEDEEYNKQEESDDLVDPTLFLDRTEEEGYEPMPETSATYDYENDRSAVELGSAAADGKEAACRACNLKFSTRANARRHERNLHPNLFELSSSQHTGMLVTKPTAAFQATVEAQRAAAAAAAAAASAAAETSVSKSTTMLSEQKYRQEVLNAFNKCETGTFDYDNPEKYQHLLTDEKIVFLQQNEEFLDQYQSMTCRCCNKYHATYKNFMAHMRKKYTALPRNLCFNCLKLNDSKALFISHLKRRNCINLYKVLHGLMAKNASFAAAVTATAASVPEKLRAKELLVNKMYECKLCPKQFRLKLEFRSHVYDDHADLQKKDVGQTQCSFCAVNLEDPAERKRHYNNMDCIVTLRCVTCDAKFENHQKFLDHVYDKHLASFALDQGMSLDSATDPSPGKKSSIGLGGASSTDESRSSQSAPVTTPKSQYFSRMPQACPICAQQYNNYNNVLRHMESKHPDQLPQTYKCVKCGVGYPRLSNLREHMLNAHSTDKARHTGFEYIVNADAVKITDTSHSHSNSNSNSNSYSGRYDYVMKDLMSITNGGSVDDDIIETSAKKIRLDNNVYSSLKECPICNAVFSNNIGLSNHMRSHTSTAQGGQAASQAGRTAAANSVSTLAAGKGMQHQTAAQQAMFKRSLEQAADRRFRRMRCRICQRRFSSKKSYRIHMLNDHQIRNVQFIKCKLCDAEFAYEKGLKVHMFKIHNTLLKDEMIIKQFECDICSIVYRTEDQLLQHKRTVHGDENAKADESTTAATAMAPMRGSKRGSNAANASNRSSLDQSVGPVYWYQCKYCPSNFNTNKKLAIHINSHDEFDSNDYSCKDCGNVYSGRKSLWVHRYKKHPQIAEPSECVHCKKVFFDSQMLENHIPNCTRKQCALTPGSTAERRYRHKTGDDDEENSHDGDENGGGGGGAGSGVKANNPTVATLGGGEVEITAIPAGNLKIKLPEVACTICAQRFTDQELFAKHIQMHEMELYTDNPLASMFDTGPADPNQFYLDRVNDNGEYACDLCPKTFTQMTAFKVHRKWHFRGDSKQNQVEADPAASATPQTSTSLQHQLGLQAVGLMRNPLSRSQKRKRELKCEYCPSTFISNNNLRRHIYELHKDAIGNLPEPPKIDIDPNMGCRRCDIKFETKQEWIEHKVAEARIMKPFGPFQWGCDLCGAYVSRKEKLINHIYNHTKEKTIVPADEQAQEDERKQQETGEKLKGLGKDEDEQSGDDEMKQDEKDEYEDDAMDDEGEADDEEGDGDTYVDYEEAEEDDDVEMAQLNNMHANDDDDEEEEEEEEEDEVEGDCDAEGDADGDHDVEGDVDGDADGDGDEHDGEADGDVDDPDDDEDIDDTNDEDTNDAPKLSRVPTSHLKLKSFQNSAETTEAEDSRSYVGDDDEDVEDDVEEEEEEEEDEESASSADEAATKPITPAPVFTKVRFSCDLCNVYFDSQQELQKHVKMHFLNGPGSVTLTDLKPKVSVNKNRNSNTSDVVAVSSS